MTASVPATAAPAERAELGGFWWVALVAGILTLLVGIAALVFPGPTLVFVSIMVGIYLVAWGILGIFRAIAGTPGGSVVGRFALVVLGVITVLAGLLLIVRPGESVVAIAWIMGFWWVIAGVLQVVAGIVSPEGRGWNIGVGLLGIVAGAIILAQPEIGLITLVWIVSIGLIVQGALEIAAGLEIRRLHKEGLA